MRPNTALAPDGWGPLETCSTSLRRSHSQSNRQDFGDSHFHCGFASGATAIMLPLCENVSDSKDNGIQGSENFGHSVSCIAES